jgi:hypothetical protein
MSSFKPGTAFGTGPSFRQVQGIIELPAVRHALPPAAIDVLKRQETHRVETLLVNR